MASGSDCFLLTTSCFTSTLSRLRSLIFFSAAPFECLSFTLDRAAIFFDETSFGTSDGGALAAVFFFSGREVVLVSALFLVSRFCGFPALETGILLVVDEADEGCSILILNAASFLFWGFSLNR